MAHAVTVQGRPRFFNHLSGAYLKAYPDGDKMVISLSEQIPIRGDLLEDRRTGKWYGVKDTITLYRKWNERRKPRCSIMVVPITAPIFLPQVTPRKPLDNPHHYQSPNNWPTSADITPLLGRDDIEP